MRTMYHVVLEMYNIDREIIYAELCTLLRMQRKMSIYMNLTTTTKTVAELKKNDVVLASYKGTFAGDIPMRIFECNVQDSGELEVALAHGWESTWFFTTPETEVQFIGNGIEFDKLWF